MRGLEQIFGTSRANVRLASITSGYILLASIQACSSPASKKLNSIEPFPHPQQADALSTLTLIQDAGYELTDSHQIKKCKEKLRQTIGEINDASKMVKALERLQAVLAKNDRKLFHWCFYQQVAALDDKLASKEGMENRSAYLNKSMGTLWILAKALEHNFADSRYYNYLQKRYIQMSRDLFGRSVEKIAR